MCSNASRSRQHLPKFLYTQFDLFRVENDAVFAVSLTVLYPLKRVPYVSSLRSFHKQRMTPRHCLFTNLNFEAGDQFLRKFYRKVLHLMTIHEGEEVS
jgi:hypothetical protein